MTGATSECGEVVGSSASRRGSGQRIVARIATLGAGLGAFSGLTIAFDYLLYPFVIWRLGPLAGGALMTAASLLVCLALLRLYDWSKRDWLGIEAVKAAREYHGPSPFRDALARLLRFGDWGAFFVLSIQFDPFVTVIYMRRGSSHFGGLRGPEWRVFLLSSLVGTAYWTAVSGAGVALLTRLFE